MILKASFTLGSEKKSKGRTSKLFSHYKSHSLRKLCSPRKTTRSVTHLEVSKVSLPYWMLTLLQHPSRFLLSQRTWPGSRFCPNPTYPLGLPLRYYTSRKLSSAWMASHSTSVLRPSEHRHIQEHSRPMVF